MNEKTLVLSKVRTIVGWILVVIGILTTASNIASMFFFVGRVGYLLFSVGILLIGTTMARRPQKGFVYVILGIVLLVIGIVLVICRL